MLVELESCILFRETMSVPAEGLVPGLSFTVLRHKHIIHARNRKYALIVLGEENNRFINEADMGCWSHGSLLDLGYSKPCPNPIPPPIMPWLSAVLKHNLEIVPVNWEITDHTLRQHSPQSVPWPSHAYSTEKSSFSLIGWHFWPMHNPYNLFNSSLKMHIFHAHNSFIFINYRVLKFWIKIHFGI